MFRNRRDAGRRLAIALEPYRLEAPVVLGVPPGGVVVGHEVARMLRAPLDVADGAREPIDLHGRTVILVGDGIAAGGEVAAVLRSVRGRGGRRIVLAVPVASREALAELSPLVERVVCLRAPSYLGAISAWYEDFKQPGDQEVEWLLQEARAHRPDWEPPVVEEPPLAERVLTIDADGVPLPAHLSVPPAPRALVIFAHETGSSRSSPRNQRVAELLHRRGLATLLFDLLTAREEQLDELTGELRADLPLLAERLGAATDWVRRAGPLRGIPLAYFGADAGAAAALIAAAERPGVVRSIVSRGGRPELARQSLFRVTAPVLLVVGGADGEVLRANQRVSGLLPPGSRLTIIPGATHFFGEAGALDRVGDAAGRWIIDHLGEAGEAYVTPMTEPAHAPA